MTETCGHDIPTNAEIPALTVRDHNALGPCTRVGCGVCGGPRQAGGETMDTCPLCGEPQDATTWCSCEEPPD